MAETPRLRFGPALIATLLLGAVPAAAQVARSGGGGGDQRAAQQLQQLAQERTALQAENARLKRELEQAQADLKGAKAERDAVKARLTAAADARSRAAACEASEQALSQSKAKLEELIGRYREAVQGLKTVETDRAHADKVAAERLAARDACFRTNEDLYAIANEALSRYEAYAGPRHEPFTRIARNRLENYVDEARQHAAQLRISATQTPTPPH
jgi:chromosome segregation ATPase